MVLKFGSNTISEVDDSITYNGNEVNKVIFNGDVVWEKQTTPGSATIFESSIAGTYDIVIPTAGNYHIIAVGGGGESGCYMSYTIRICSSGYGGGYINVYKTLNVGTYTATIGGANTNTTFDTLQAGGGHVYYQQTSLNSIANSVTGAYQVWQNVTDIKVSDSNYEGYGKGGTINVSSATAGYLKIVRL